MSQFGQPNYESISRFDGLRKDQPDGAQNERCLRKQGRTLDTSLHQTSLQSQHSNSNAFFGNRNQMRQISSRVGDTLQNDHDGICFLRKSFSEGEHSRRSIPENSNHAQCDIRPTTPATRFENSAKTSSYHHAGHVSVLEKRCDSAEAGRELDTNTSSVDQATNSTLPKR
jgi:hypothetical protein